MADLRDFTKKNPIFVGTDGLRLPSGNSAQRVASANVNGTMRFNTDIAGMEMYTPTGWIPFASPPSISTVTPSTYTGESGTQFVLNGAGFTSDAQVYFITSNGTTMLATTVSFIGSAELRATTPRAIRVQEEPISVRVNQQSGIATKVDCIDAGGVPNWITTAGTLGSIFGANTVNVYVSATDPEGTSVTYQITSGSLPGGLNFTTANGLIQGLASSVLANTTYNFTIKANDTVSNNTDRSFSYTVLNRAPVINTAAGSLGTIYSGNAASASISAYDPDGGQLTYSVSSGTLPVNSSLGSANGVITGTPVVVTTNTTYSFTLTSTDEGSLTASNNYTYTVLNRPPLINTAAGSLGTIVSGNAISTTIDAYDPDGAAVSFAITSGNLMATANIGSSNGTITASNDLIVLANTTYTFTVRATDVGEMSVSNTYTYTVLNRPPLWNTAATLTPINGADVYTPITVNAYDPDGGSVTYSLTSGSVPSGLSFVSANATITGTPDEVFSNTTSTFTLTVTDPGSDANARTFNLTVTPIIDTQFANTVLLLKTSGNTAIKDASSDDRSLTVVADTHALNFSPFNTSWSNFFDSSTTTGFSFPQHADYSLGTGDFTVEAFIYISETNSNGNYPIAIYGWGPQGGSPASYASWHIHIDSLTTLRWYRFDGGTETVYSFGSTFAQRTWYHVAITRSGTSIRAFVNGAQIGTTQTSSTSYNLVNGSSGGTDLLYVGKVGGGGAETFPGYISNFRVVKGTAVYTANTSPITSPLTAISGTALLTCQSNRIKDSSNNNATATYIGSPKVTAWSPFEETDTTTGSMYFDGTGDYLNLGTPYNFGTNNFTVEGWFYLTTLSGTYGLWGASNGGGGQAKLQPYVSSGNITLDLNGGSAVAATAATYLQTNAWNHIAFCRGGTGTNQTAMFINGVRAAVGTVGSQTGITTNFTIGFNEAGAISASYISNFRIVDGTDVYGYTNTTYTVPTAPLTAIANTKLLTLQNRQPHNNHGFIDSSRNKLMITRFGNTTQGTFTPFSADPGKWCNYFNGSSGVRFADNAAFQFGTSAFTVEGWFNVASAPSNDASVISKWVAANDGNSSWMIDFQSSNLSAAISIGGSVTRITGSSGLPLGVWNHFALVRSGSPGTLSLFLNGNRIATATPTGSLVDDSNPVGIGVRGGTDSYYLTGYLTNIRVVNGTALYDPTLTTHTIPTGPLSVVTNTKLLTCQNNQFIDNSTANSGAGFGATTLSTPFVQPFSPFAPNSVYTTANTGGSLYLDGSGDYLLTPSIPNFAFRSGQFTMEAWHYGTTASGGGQLVSSRAGSVNDAATISFYITSGQYSFYGNGNHVAANYVTGQWNHVVYTRDASSTLRLFINGKLANYEASFTPNITATTVAIGALTNGGEILPACWASDIRLVSGYIPTAYQTSSTTNGTQIFTPPTAPLTTSSQGALPNTVTMLMNFTDAAIIDVTGKNILETSAAARANTTAYKFSPGSMSFDASSSTRVQTSSASAPPLFNFGTSNHTVEGWLKAASSGSQMCMFDFRSSDTSGQGVGIFYSTSRTIFVYMQGNRITSSTLTNGTWYHVAVVRASNVYTLYVDGVSQGTWANSDAVAPPANRPYIGAVSDGSQVFDGLIQDVRVTRGARYTANFTPPTRTFPNR
jgi:hypothetical protein